MRLVFTNQVPAAGRMPRAAFLSLAKTSGRVIPALRGGALVAVSLVSPAASKRLNRAYRSKNRPTNVLSFASESAGELGDIIICPAVARKEAREMGIALGNWMNYLFVHGLLHLAGFDHTSERVERAMEDRAKRILGTNYPL